MTAHVDASEPVEHGKSAWTGGQYSLIRMGLGVWVVTYFTSFFDPFVAPASSHDAAFWIVVGAGITAGVLLAVGLADRAMALGAIALGAYQPSPDLVTIPELPFILWLLIAHVLLPLAPYGSLAALGRPDAGADWRMPALTLYVSWTLMCLSYMGSGLVAFSVAEPDNNAGPPYPISLILAVLQLAAPLMIVGPLRRWIWSALLLAHVSGAALLVSNDLWFGTLLMQAATFDPRWLPPRDPSQKTLFYDGECGICQGAVRFVLSEDRARAFMFAPLGGERFLCELTESERAGLPDSVVIRTESGEILTRSAAALTVLESLGGFWRALAYVARVIPSDMRDAAYDLVARNRPRRASPEGLACPILPPHLRERFV